MLATSKTCLIYGAYGYTGELVVREAVSRGLRPILAGRRPEALEQLSGELELTYRSFGLEDGEAIPRLLEDVAAVLHCAGPFVHTSRTMVDSCLRSGTHYLDITGEIGVLESIYNRGAEARDAGVALLPGTGLDVVPSDCLASHLAQRLPDATRLELALDIDRGSASGGTLSTMVEALPDAGAERVEGQILSRPPVFDSREIEFTRASRWAMTIPWGDLASAYRSTGIPNIRVYLGASPKRIKRWRRLAPALPLLGNRGVKKALKWLIRHRISGPTEAMRESARVSFWGSVSNEQGENRKALLETPESYKLTAMTSVECLHRVLEGRLDPGAWTPATAFGADFIKTFPGVFASW